jgi:predicted nucleic acid-binding protein
MNPRKALVLDANILLRAVFGTRVRQLLETYDEVAAFFSPDACFDEAQEYVSDLAERRGVDSSLALSVLAELSRVIVPVDKSLYESYERLARERIQRRDPDDWPVVAVALMLDIPVWTEDRDFFGSGIPTWTTDKVELYLRGSAL